MYQQFICDLSVDFEKKGTRHKAQNFSNQQLHILKRQ